MSGTVTRRDVLRVGGLGALGLAVGRTSRADRGSTDRAVIQVVLVGGPSQHETFDPKPDAPSEVRGPFGSIATAVPGVRLGEHLPGLARRMDRLMLIRSLHHEAAPIHETGLQLLQTGRLSTVGDPAPHLGAVASQALGPRRGARPWALVPGRLGPTGVDISHGQSAGSLGSTCEAVVVGVESAIREEPSATRAQYGETEIGRSLLQARRLVESGTRIVTVNAGQTVFDRRSWDCHGHGPFSTLADYERTLLPEFDRAISALIDDLEGRGLLETTLVVASGEFGRTPRINPAGGRDHWPGVWSAVVAGGGMAGGQVLGASDGHAAEPAERPVSPIEVWDLMARGLGLDPDRIA